MVPMTAVCSSVPWFAWYTVQ